MFHSMVREPVCRFIMPPFGPLLDYFGPDTTPAAYASVAIVEGFGCRPKAMKRLAPGLASESLQ